MPETITISRDARGVPHIQAQTERGAIYAQGYVQAVDRLPSVYVGYHMVAGTLDEAYILDVDAVIGSLALYDSINRAYNLCADVSLLPADDRDLLHAFIDGLNAGIAASRDRWGPDVMTKHIAPTPQLALQLAQAVTFPFIMDQALPRINEPPATPPLAWQLASNAWAVRPDRTADGSTLLLTDPHVIYSADWLLHEVELRGGDLHVYGFQHPGTPYVHFGHTPHVAWGFTAGGAKVVNVEQRRQPPPQRGAAQVRTVNGQDENANPAVFHVRTTYDGVPFDHIAPLRKLAHARTIDDVKSVIARNQFGPWNMIAADSAGNIHYSIVGRVPINGDVSKGIHPAAELPQVTNPPAGWLMHTNCSPWNVTPGSPLTRATYPDYMLFTTPPASDDGNNPRGRDLHKRLLNHARMTLDDAQAIAMSVDLSEAEPLLRWLLTFDRKDVLHAVVKGVWLLKSLHPNMLATPAVYRDLNGLSLLIETYLYMVQDNEFDAVMNALLRGEMPTAGYASLDAAVANIDDYFAGEQDVPYSDYLRLVRGKKALPVVGAPNFCQRIVANVTGSEVEATNAAVDIPFHQRIDYGQVCPLLVAFTPHGVRSFAVVPFGQSDDPSSPHYDDQMETFAAAKFYETGFATPDSGRTIETIEMA
jgi:acyl-homoserine-lactone acylase